MKVERKTTDDPRWCAWLLLSTPGAGAAFVLEGALSHDPWWTSLFLPVAAAVNIAVTFRSRLRITDAGIEGRKLRTRLYRWSDIASVGRAPDWESTSVVWLRLRGSVSTSAPEVLGAPGTRGRASRSRALDDIVTLGRRRLASDSAA